jgi:hypothetical protein
MMKPSIHLNGSSRKDLLDQQTNAMISIRTAIEAVSEACPNARDYYPQGDQAYSGARAEHVSRLERLHAILKEYEEIADAIVDAK